VQGEWWTPGQVFTKPLISIEEDAATQLGLTVGDTVELAIQGVPITGEISNIRQVEWGNFSTNFYMIFSPGALDGAPHTYVATVRVAPSEEVTLQQAVVASFPNVTAINMGEVFDSFARVLDRLSLAIRAVALFCVASGCLVMAAALAATRYRRLYESVILKALGATRSVIVRSFAAEYALLGALGGLLGCALASVLSWAVLETVFDLSWSLQPAVLAMDFTATVTLTMLVGFLSTYRILGQPPLAVLRHE
jgi:putative ABC transport system permease protein